MEGRSTLSYKGQVTVPKLIRERLQLKPGDGVVFVLRDDVVVIERDTRSILEWYGTLSGHSVRDWHAMRDAVMAEVAADTAAEGLPADGPSDDRPG
jgi:AbrB family looped-hinge helix DNA binding protein